MIALARRALRRLRGELARLNPRELWWNFLKSRRDRRFDRDHNVETAGTLLPSAFGVPREARRLSVRYLSSEPDEFERALAQVPCAHRDCVFVDLGSGKGKVLMLASAYPFRRIVGVELSPRLHRVAERNLARFRSDRQQCRQFELVCADVLAYEFPDEPLVVYLYNPFLAELQGSVAARLRAAWERRPRPLHVVYVNPVHAAIWEQAGFRVLARADLLAVLVPA